MAAQFCLYHVVSTYLVSEPAEHTYSILGSAPGSRTGPVHVWGGTYTCASQHLISRFCGAEDTDTPNCRNNLEYISSTENALESKNRKSRRMSVFLADIFG
jgi:hypothetical protein